MSDQTIYELKYNGLSRTELRRRAYMFQVLSEQAGRDIEQRRYCENVAREMEEASLYAPSVRSDS